MKRRAFSALLAHLILYETEHGDMKVPENYKADDGYELFHNVEMLTDEYRNGALSQEQIERLERIGFTFDKDMQDWETMYRRAKDYVREYGRLPDISYRTEEQVLLGAWVHRQTVVYERLSEEQKEKLEDIGVVSNRII